jgi:hypothetical protein
MMARIARFPPLQRVRRAASMIWAYLRRPAPHGDFWAAYDVIAQGILIGLVISMVVIWLLMPRGAI